MTPPAQLFSVPSTLVPVGSSAVFSRSLPAAGPVTCIGVVAVERAVAHHLPFAVDLQDFDHGAAMRGHLDVDARLVSRRHLQLAIGDADDAREHEVLVGVFVFHHQQAMRGRAAERDEADIVVVAAELPALGFGGLVLRVEGGGVGKERVAQRNSTSAS